MVLHKIQTRFQTPLAGNDGEEFATEVDFNGGGRVRGQAGPNAGELTSLAVRPACDAAHRATDAGVDQLRSSDRASLYRDRPGWGPLYALGWPSAAARWLACLLAAAAAGQDADPVPTASFTVGDDDRVRIEIPSAASRYHVLHYRSDPDDPETEHPVAVHLGAENKVTLTEPMRVGLGGAYRVATYLQTAPGDADGDGVDDLAELARTAVVGRAPLNAATPIGINDGAVTIPDIETFRVLSYEGGADRNLRDLEFIKFIVADVRSDAPVVYYINANKWTWHSWFARGVLGWPSAESFKPKHFTGEMVYHPHLVGPHGDVGTFRFQNQYNGGSFSLEEVSTAYELIAATMPFLRNNLVYHPVPWEVGTYKRLKAKFDASRVPVFLDDDLFAGSVFQALNAAVGYGMLRVLGSGERPTFRDVVILRHLPNELSAVAGIISLERQTPLSHVNLRAVQDGVPNAYLGTALDDATIAGLVGRYVRYEVSARGDGSYTIAEATAAEVAAHHAARRPAAGQTPTRDLTVTGYRDLDAVAFADAEAFGVKAANLAVLRTFGLTNVEVPDGYALPFYYYDEFMKHNGFYDDVDALLADTDFGANIATRDAELAKLRRRIENGAMPAWMKTSLKTLQGLFAAGTAIRCRSSTNNEDLPGFSGAGLYDSVTHRASEGHLSKSVKEVFASLWNLRAFEERDFYRVDHKAAAMGVLLHPNFSDERVNGVAVSDDPLYGTANAYYVNAQVGEELVTNPSARTVPEELLLTQGDDFETTVLSRSSLVADDGSVLSEAHIATLHAALREIHTRFKTLYAVADDQKFAMEIEFKVTAEDAFAIKQARPWVY